MKILNVFPDVYTEDLKKTKENRKKFSENLKEQTNKLVELETVFVDKGSASIEDAFDEAVNAPYILQKVKTGKKEGYDAVVIDCFGDPGLDAARELVDIPVIGANHSACFLATQLGARFSIINILKEVEPLVRNLLMKYGLYNRVASMRVINVPVLDLEKEPEKNAKKVPETVKKTVLEDGAYSVVFGCTGMAFLLGEVRKVLAEEEGIDVPIIEPLKAAVYNAVYWVLYGTSHSKLEFPPPREKKRLLDFEI
ncbi:hypothetical protein AKJ62_04520 [candidate division MSBL1 archaeon SCGC-AAA259D14]|uniref:Hydrogenase expression protein HupH n=1 Tax=candidate division MSBL1 archaeon SCGC-AAA259D14 TaxID=1698261 RepID=A0A133U3J9_9EURY|nr:hypothetical protein AKJ62_04520 [candidate division MSBL1 archaeon SCGC-AAA259D14]